MYRDKRVIDRSVDSVLDLHPQLDMLRKDSNEGGPGWIKIQSSPDRTVAHITIFVSRDYFSYLRFTSTINLARIICYG